MISVKDLRKLARARLRDAEVLSAARRYDAAVYMVGYAVEAALKARICKTLRWNEFPLKPGEFKEYSSLKVHRLPVLLRLSGREEMINKKYSIDWSAVAAWDPETRYRPVGGASKRDAEIMIVSATILMRAL